MKNKTHLNIKKASIVSSAFLTLIAAGYAYGYQTSTVSAASETNEEIATVELVEEEYYSVELNSKDAFQDVVASMLEYDSFMSIAEVDAQVYTDNQVYLDLSEINPYQLGEQDITVRLGVYDATVKEGAMTADYVGQEQMVPGVVYEKDITVNVGDTTAPTIALTKSSVTLEYGAKFNAKSYLKSVTDNSGENIEANISSEVDTKKAGTYEVTYTATDLSGNTSKKTLSVKVKEEVKPVVTTPAVSGSSSSSTTIAPITNVSGINGMFTLINNERAARGLAPLSFAPSAAQQAANLRAQEARGYVSHTRPNGTSFQTALTQYGVKYNSALENLTYAGNTAQAGFTWWMNSSGHRAALLNANMRYIAIGYYNGMWCAILYN
ncbi:MAG: CAP domain-containing protein [Erysipelotrichaceae bacterium]